MKKIIGQGLAMIGLFGIIYYAFLQVDFMSLLNVNEGKKNLDQKLGEMIWKSIERTEDVIRDKTVNFRVRKLVDHITEQNDIDPKSIKVYVIQNDEVNAFAIPNRHLIVYSGLIAACANEAELAGVLSHELAHIEKSHVMKKLVKEVGLAVLIGMTTGDRSSSVHEAAHVLSSSAYDRNLETEADFAAVDYLIKSDIDPQPFANFMFQMSNYTEFSDELEWISTHPNSEERATAIIDYISDREYVNKQVLTNEEWQQLKKAMSEN